MKMIPKKFRTWLLTFATVLISTATPLLFGGAVVLTSCTPEEALRREIREELDTHITVGELLHTIEWDYPKFHLPMHCFLCTVESGSLTLLEHEAARWLAPHELDSVQWLPADWEVIEILKQRFQTE